jgi:hypothetical protein
MKKNKLQQRLRQLASKAKVSDVSLEDAVGGYGYGGYFNCRCSWGPNPTYVGNWSSFYMNTHEMLYDISRKCYDGRGGCTQAY